jgi:threonine synthase
MTNDFHTITYQSTRGQAPELGLRAATMAGLAADGGLYVPTRWPHFSDDALAAMRGKPYVTNAFQVLQPFVTDSIPDDVLKNLLSSAYTSFAVPDVTPLKQLSDNLWILELFHGPTLAFKDVALQLLGHVFGYFLQQSGERITVIGATSGDTGSAAMAALANRPNVDVFILYPYKGPSDIQRKQMTCIDAPNVHAVAIEGTFDDCQGIVKSLFNDQALRAHYNFTAINSINWFRLLAQMVYYFVAASHFAPKPVSFVVPTGNFGNVYAAYAASECGVPIAKLAVASNRNDILTRFFNSGTMKAEGVQSSLSPSMDIQISSNFERLLFDLCDRDGGAVRRLMEEQRATRNFSVSPLQLGKARQIFTAAKTDDETTLQTIKAIYTETGYILDPHSAVGVNAARQLTRELPQPVINLACAHPAKFPETIQRAIGITPKLPESILELMAKPERSALLPANVEAVMKFMSDRLRC